MRPSQSGRAGRRGQAVVEFALVLPVFLLLLFGAIEFGRAYLRLHLLTNASREGGRVGSLPEKLEEDVYAAVQDFLDAAGLPSSEYSVEVKVFPEGVELVDGNQRSGGLADAEQGDRVLVEVNNDFQVLSGSLIPGFQGTVPMQAECVFRHE